MCTIQCDAAVKDAVLLKEREAFMAKKARMP